MTANMQREFFDARVLVVDDEPSNVLFLEKLLAKTGYTNVVTTTDPRRVLPIFMSEPPDIVLLDLHMPHVDGFQLMAELERWISGANGVYLPVLVLTADITSDAKQKSLSMGAKDFVTKPFDKTEVLLRMRNLLETRSLHLELTDQNARLDQKVRERTADLWEAVGHLEQAKQDLQVSREETIHRLSIAAEFRDDETSRHIQRMSHYCGLIARAMGWDEERSELIRLASQMHDVGKIGTPDSILLKPGPLTPEERAIMQQHAEIGYQILAGSTSDLMQLAASIALTHHERVDGTGYPRGLSDEEIPEAGRIAAVADVFDALTTNRVYRKAYALGEALDIMREGRGTHFDPDLLDLFFKCLPDALAYKQHFEDGLAEEEVSYSSGA
jgi:putative two-component system response regulator